MSNETTKICINCSARMPIKAKFCNQCGKKEFYSNKKCKYCNNNLPFDQSIKFCPHCGKRISTEKAKLRIIVAPEGVIHKCGICRLDINTDLTPCPSCLNTFHFNHLSNWILEKNQCPICKTKLVFE